MAKDTGARREALAWLQRYIAGLEEPALGELALRLSSYAADAIPELDEPAIRDDLQALSRESLRSLFAALPNDPWRDPDVPVAAMEFTRALARQGYELPVLLKVYRLGQAEFWNSTMEVAERDIPEDAVRMDVLTLMWRRVTLWMEAMVAYQVTLYEEERERWMRGALAQRSEMIHAILAGEDVDPARAGQILSHEMSRHHVALALWADAEASVADAATRLEALASDLAAALGARRVLTTAAGARGRWAWIGSDAAPDMALLTRTAAERAEGLRVAVGRPGRGLAGFRESHREALAAQRIAMAGVRRDPVTSFADVEIASLLSSDEAAMRRLVERELTGLLARDASTARLRATALAFLSSGSNARVAAELLGTHKNTVLYRVRRVEELLGRPIEERRLQLELALTVADVFGDAVLPADAPR